jgi:hypothetical protein
MLRIIGGALTLGASVQAERAVDELDLGGAVRDIPLLLRLIVERLAIDARVVRILELWTWLVERPKATGTYTTTVLPLVRALGTMTNLGFTLDEMYTLR